MIHVPPTVVLLTDFGTRDGYVAAMKGAMLSHVPGLRFVDVTHEIAPGDVAGAAWVLRQAAPQFPSSCVHLVVVDPGVGTQRRAIACTVQGRRYVAPDNGVLHWVLGSSVDEHEVEAHELAPRADASAVFHGRDLFGPAAARIAAGEAQGVLGAQVRVASLVRLGFKPPQVTGAIWCGSVVHVDRFGNAITDLLLDDEARGTACFAEHRIPLARTYGDVAPGTAVAVRGSSGTLELSVRDSSAAQTLGVAVGDVITFRVA